MTLQLTIIKFPPGVSLSEDRKSIGSEGCRIGRGVDNDWILSDPERFLSSKHCKITVDNDQIFLADLSTNGTFLNGAAEPLGRGQRTVVKDGDSFDVGDYRFKVSLTAAAGAFPDDPFKDSPSQLTPPPSDFGNAEPSNGVYMSNEYGGEVNDITPDAMRVTDPLVAIDNAQREKSGMANDPGAFASPPRDDVFPELPKSEVGGAGDQGFLQDSAEWPEAKGDFDVLPEDWDSDISLLKPKNTPEPPPKSDPPPVKTKANPYFLPDDDSLIVNRETPGQKANTEGRAKPVVPKSTKTAKAVLQKQKAAQAKPKATPPKATVGRQTRPAGGAVDRSLVDAMGLQDMDLSDEQIREIHETIGLMMRETLGGLMQILRSRASIKNEFRINITTIQPVENNPIKFSANVDEILELMFLRKSKAYKEPLDALQESFHSIADHQLAVIAGIRSAFRSSLSKFDPLILEEEFKQMNKGSGLSGLFKGNFWKAYQDHYQSMVNDVERSFQDLFGNEFVDAYEDQLRKLAQARKNDV